MHFHPIIKSISILCALYLRVNCVVVFKVRIVITLLRNEKVFQADIFLIANYSLCMSLPGGHKKSAQLQV